MTAILALLGLTARYGRIFLVAGLVAGVMLPDLALAMKPWLPELVGTLLFMAALRIGPRAAVGAIGDLPATIGAVLLFQLFLPVVLILVAIAGGWIVSPIAISLVLMLSAPSISGSPNLTVMTGHDPTAALRLLVLGTCLLPLTVLGPFWLLPELGSAREVFGAAGRLLAVIALAGAAGFLIRGFILRELSVEAVRAIDGLSAIAMAVVVVGLMSAVGPAIVETPLRFAGWLLVACLADFGLQFVAAHLIRHTRLRDDHVAYAVVAGNRNIALFLIALPANVTDPLLLFIGCYQIPMYLTPIVMRRFYRVAPERL